MKKFIVDRFEENYAVLENEMGKTVDVLRNEIPDAKEGDIIILRKGKYIIDTEETSRRKKIIAEKLRKLFEKK